MKHFRRQNMNYKSRIIPILLLLLLITPLIPACSNNNPTSYTAVIPAVFQSGVEQAVAIALFEGTKPSSGKVSVTLSKDGKTITRAQNQIAGQGEIHLSIPDLAPGEYSLEVKGAGFDNQTSIKVDNSTLVFLETDKPIYKPGQTVMVRLMTLNTNLRPAPEKVVVEVVDAKSLKIFRTETSTDTFGMTTLTLPISEEPNLGTWKISAQTAKNKSQLDIKVEEYVLPKYEIAVNLARDWFLVSEPVKGGITATYSYGKPVKGKLQVKAQKYVGTWENYANFTLDIDGNTSFEIPPAKYVAGVPAAQGNGNVKLEFSVTEASTGYMEKTDRLLTISQSSVNLTIIPASSTYKPGLPYSFMVVSETPGNQLIDTSLKVSINYLDSQYRNLKTINLAGDTQNGKRLFEINPPSDSIAMTINVSNGQASASRCIEGAYSPSGNFINVEQTTKGDLKTGDKAKFWVYSTQEASVFYYEIIARGQVIYTSFSKSPEIGFILTPAMAPAARLLVYQILPNSELAADYLPLKVNAQYPQSLSIVTGTQQAKPGDSLNISVQAEGESEIGLAAVDKSVYILAENRMNLQQVFDELEKLYMEPRAELHQVNIYSAIDNLGAKEVFKNAGVIILTNNAVPEGKKYKSPFENAGANGVRGMGFNDKAIQPQLAFSSAAPAPTAQSTAGGGLAEVQRVRQFFPETWLWETAKTDAGGKANFKVNVPDSITTWMLRAVAMSKKQGLGIAESQLTVFQPFFLTLDLPYSVIQGEEFPVRVAVYNYLNQVQEVQLEVESSDWFSLLDNQVKKISVRANDIGSVSFQIRPNKLGNSNPIKISARSQQYADAVIKTLIVEPSGIAKESVMNLSLSPNRTAKIDTGVPSNAVEGSARAYLAVTSSFLAQTMDGLDSLIQMPFGCGEQNMIIFAPDVYITRYLNQQNNGQIKPEILAKAQKLMLTGYQCELTFRRNDNSFSAFGQSDKSGSLWLSAFVLKCFAQAKDLIYIDPQVLEKTRDWILSQQNADGSFDAVGFVHHKDMLGGVEGKTALTAFVAVALQTAGYSDLTKKATAYLEKELDNEDNPYTLAITTYALEMSGSQRSGIAYNKLMGTSKEDENGLYWGSNTTQLNDKPVLPGLKIMPTNPALNRSAAIENTAYAALALIKHGDNFNAGRAVKWLISQRNAFGGYGSTQDTVMALQAITDFTSNSRSDVELKVDIDNNGDHKQLQVNSTNFDVMQIISLPVNSILQISASGRGDAIGQVVLRYNMPVADQASKPVLVLDVIYDTGTVSVNDEVTVKVNLAYQPADKREAGMTVVDIAIPTGFAATKESIEKMVASHPIIKRYDISGRKVIFYVDNLQAGERISFNFQVKALYPVKAKGVMSQVYSYYQPEIKAQTISQDFVISE
jgi:CD109 antigen